MCSQRTGAEIGAGPDLYTACQVVDMSLSLDNDSHTETVVLLLSEIRTGRLTDCGEYELREGISRRVTTIPYTDTNLAIYRENI